MYGPVRLSTQMMLTFLGYYRVDVHGTLASASETKLLVPNHVGAVEIFVLFGLAFPSFVSAIENTRLPFFGAICRVTDAILVDRSDPDSKRKTKSEILQRVRDKDTKSQLMVFPEGTTVSQAALFQFKRGVFEAGEPVQLVVRIFFVFAAHTIIIMFTHNTKTGIQDALP
jgi:lysophosphatidylcholine acyltransferase/lyso-PAF acetyltransferase